MGKIKSVISFGGYIALAASLFLNTGVLSADQAYNYDVNGDGVVNVLDFLNLRNHLLGADTGRGDGPSGAETDNVTPYMDLIKSLHNVIKADDENDHPVVGLGGSTGIQELKGVSALSTETAEDFIGYSIKDINGDGVYELLIGEINGFSEGKGIGNRIIALYTRKDNEPVLVFEGTARSAHYYAGGTDFVYEGSEGAAYSIKGKCTLEKNSTEVSWNEFYFTDLNENNETVLYYNTTGIYDSEKAEIIDGGNDKLYELATVYRSKIVNTEFTPFSSLNENDTPVGAQLSTNFHSRYENIDEADIPETEYTENIIFYTKEKVTDFKVLALTVSDTDSDGKPVYSTEVVYSQKELTEAEPLSVNLEFADVYALNGISYVDGNGTERRFCIYASGKDGSVYLSAF